MKQQEKKSKTNENCKDIECPFHGALRTRGRTFKGEVKKIVGKRAVLEFERVIYYPKYERYAKSKTRLHARIPQCLVPQIKVGDTIKISECRPLSKIIHFVVIEKIK